MREELRKGEKKEDLGKREKKVRGTKKKREGKEYIVRKKKGGENFEKRNRWREI